jgi:hypothetical protein
MNYIRHLTAFFDRVALDNRLNPTHISLYIALFQFWNINRFQNPISISRGEMMKVSKICANATYHKVMKDLHNYGFIRYKPSYNPFRGSEVELLKLEAEPVQERNRYHTNGSPITEQDLNHYHNKNGTGIEPINEPYINNTNSINSKQREGTRTGSKNELIKNPSVEEVHKFFLQQKSNEVEAEKFFNHFQSNGWLVGGRSPMKDWKAAAKKWMLNNLSLTTVKSASRLQLNGHDKNYSEPL